MTRPAPRSFHARLATALPAALAAVGAGATLLPWWRADRGPLLLGAKQIRELPPDVWTGAEVARPWVVVIGTAAAVAVPTALLADRLAGVARWAAACAGLAAVVAAVRTLVVWGPSAAPGVWIAVAVGAAAVGCAMASPGRAMCVSARRVTRSGTARAAFGHGGGRARAVLGVALLAVAVAAAVPGPAALPRTAAGPFVPVAAVGAVPLRSGQIGLGVTGEARPVLADGLPGVVSRAGVVVATADSRALVLARLDRGAPAPIGVVGDRVVRWVSADAVAVTGLRAGSAVDVVVRGVTEAGAPGADGSVWLRSGGDPSGTVRRLAVARLQGRQRIAATYLPVVTIHEPEPPVDLRTLLPVRGGGLRNLEQAGRLELLTGTASGIAVTPLAGRRCGAAGVARLDRTAADRSGVWFVLVGAAGERLAHLDPTAGGAVRTVAAALPGTVAALEAPGDGSVLLLARDRQGTVLWRLPDAVAALGAAGDQPVSCPPV